MVRGVPLIKSAYGSSGFGREGRDGGKIKFFLSVNIKIFDFLLVIVLMLNYNEICRNK